HDLVDMMRHLRYSDARLHVRDELPFHTGRRLDSLADVAALLA
ncbi:MAG: chlorite dismutase family protein, partial [Brachybacterium tyrofermentans]